MAQVFLKFSVKESGGRMDNRSQIENKVDQAMKLLDELDEMKPDPYFLSKLEARIKSAEKAKFSVSGWVKPALAGVLLMVNIGTALWYFSGSGNTAQTNTETQLIRYLAGDLISTENEYPFLKKENSR